MFIVWAKVGAALGLALVLLVVLKLRPWLEKLFATPGRPWLVIFWVLLRLLPFLAIYVILGYEPQSDVKEYYFPIARGAAAGKMLYRDVYCPYSPFFGYYLALPVRLWDDPRVIVLAMTLVEWLAAWLTLRQGLTEEGRGQRLFRTLVYYLLPVPFIFCIMSGQEDVGLWIFTLLAGQALLAGRSFRAGLWFGLGLLSTKAIFVLLVVPFFLKASNKVRFVAGCLALGIPVLLFLYYQTDLLFLTQPLEEGKILKAPNLRSVLSPLFGEGINKLVSFENYLGLLLTAGFSFWLCLRQRAADNQRSIALFYIFTFSLMTVLQHNAISNYAYLFMLPLALLVMPLTNNRAWIALIGFNVLAAMHPSFWWRIGMPFYYSLTDLNQARYLLDYAIEVLLVGGFAYIAYRSAQYLRSANVSPTLERTDNPKTTGATI